MLIDPFTLVAAKPKVYSVNTCGPLSTLFQFEELVNCFTVSFFLAEILETVLAVGGKRIVLLIPCLLWDVQDYCFDYCFAF